MSFEFDFTEEQLAQLIPGNDKVSYWYKALCDILPMYKITTKRKVAHFISQCAHESNNFRSLEENLNYSEKALLSVFGRYFGEPPKRNAAEYARNPEMIANYVYNDEFRSSKMGNTQEGDGWRFRGRGLKQLTGRDNYTAFGKSLGMTAEEAAEYVATEKGAVESACYYWNSRNLNDIAELDDVERMTKKINGGTIGLEDRTQRYFKALEVLGVDPAETHSLATREVLRVGSRGETVKLMQKALGIGADGIFGKGTEASLKEWQQQNGLVADGVAGPSTLGKLLYEV